MYLGVQYPTSIRIPRPDATKVMFWEQVGLQNRPAGFDSLITCPKVPKRRSLTSSATSQQATGVMTNDNFDNKIRRRGWNYNKDYKYFRTKLRLEWQRNWHEQEETHEQSKRYTQGHTKGTKAQNMVNEKSRRRV